MSKRTGILSKKIPGALVIGCLAAGLSLPGIPYDQPLLAQTGSDAGSDRSALDALTWRGASSADTEQGYRAYLSEFPDGLFADLAVEKLKSLEVAAPATSSLAADPASSEPEAANPAPVQPASSQIAEGDAAVPENTETPAVDRAYIPPERPDVPLPVLPATPQLAQDGYPGCRENYQKLVSPFDRIDSINRCTVMIDVYYTDTLNIYREQMIDHQNEISEIYTSKVAGNAEYAGKRHNEFYEAMMKEHAASNPDGDHLSYYREMDAKYKEDRTYLEDRYCFNAGCNGYTAPDFDYALNNQEDGSGKKDKKKSAGKKKCGAARVGGGLLGGLIGGLGGKALGLGKVGQLIAGGAGAILGSALACQLSKKEQKQAAQATAAVVEKEEVGATAEWKSPERKGVSGSSTVTALNTEPNGATCLDITDVAIIDGEETRVSKRMCRLAGKGRYTVMA